MPSRRQAAITLIEGDLVMTGFESAHGGVALVDQIVDHARSAHDAVVLDLITAPDLPAGNVWTRDFAEGRSSTPTRSRQYPAPSLWTPADHASIMPVMSEPDEGYGKLDRITLRLMYRPIAMVGGVVGGLLASMALGRLWRAIAGKGEIPEPTDQSQSWPEILLAAALHGIVFGVVKAVIDRLNAKQFERKTGFWPGKRSPAADTQT